MFTRGKRFLFSSSKSSSIKPDKDKLTGAIMPNASISSCPPLTSTKEVWSPSGKSTVTNPSKTYKSVTFNPAISSSPSSSNAYVSPPVARGTTNNKVALLNGDAKQLSSSSSSSSSHLINTNATPVAEEKGIITISRSSIRPSSAPTESKPSSSLDFKSKNPATTKSEFKPAPSTTITFESKPPETTTESSPPAATTSEWKPSGANTSQLKSALPTSEFKSTGTTSSEFKLPGNKTFEWKPPGTTGSQLKPMATSSEMKPLGTITSELKPQGGPGTITSELKPQGGPGTITSELKPLGTITSLLKPQGGPGTITSELKLQNSTSSEWKNSANKTSKLKPAAASSAPSFANSSGCKIWKPSASLSSTSNWNPSSAAATSSSSAAAAATLNWKPSPASSNQPSSSSSVITWKPSSSSSASSLAVNASPPAASASSTPASASGDAEANHSPLLSSSTVTWKPSTASDEAPLPSQHKELLVSVSNTANASVADDSPLSSLSSSTKDEPIDDTIFDAELTEEWWNSFMKDIPRTETVSMAAPPPAATIISSSFGSEDGRESATSPISNTAAVLRLSSNLTGAIRNTSLHDQQQQQQQQQQKQEQQRTLEKMKHGKGLQNNVTQNDILDEWRSGFYENKKKDDDRSVQKDYDRLNEIHVLKNQHKNANKMADDDEVESRPSRDSKKEEEESKPTDSKSDSKADSKTTRTPVKFEGIGPTEAKTGVPIATRVSIDEKNRKQWYKQMYASLNRRERPAPVKTLENGLDDRRKPRSPSPKDNNDTPSYYPPHAKYKTCRYRNDPLRIEDYEPGYHHSSIAIGDLDQNRFFESDAEVDYRNGGVEFSNFNELSTFVDGMFQADNRSECGTTKKAAEKKGPAGGVRSKPRKNKMSRQKLDEENARRKREIEVVMAEERRRRYAAEQKENEMRRHKDCLTPIQKTTILLNRFKDDEIGGMQRQRPAQVKAAKFRGKARATYTFKAQNNKELSFKKGDTIYLLRKIDRNWFEGEHNGIVGIFPIAYVDVITSLDEARNMALQREGKATALYDFRAKAPNELTLQKGDVVTLIRKIDQNWYEGRVGKRRGIFPLDFVETIREPDTPLATPMSSHVTTPMPGSPGGRLSPASSICSGGPEVPSAPMSPWNSDFYDSEFEPDLRDFASAGTTTAARSPKSKGNRSAFDHVHQKEDPSQSKPPTTYYTLPTRSKGARSAGTATAAAQKHEAESRRKHEDDEKDLFVLASRRRRADVAGSAVEKERRSASLGGNADFVRPSYSVDSASSQLQFGQKSQSLDFSQPKKVSKDHDLASYQRYLALYDYKPKNLDELELKEGDVVYVMEFCEDGWYVGFSENGNEFGTFPGNYVQMLS